jgi:hypothetical protein
MYDFKTDLEVGKRFEHKFITHMCSKGVPDSWITQSEGKVHDWDVCITTPDGKQTTYEIKRDFVFKNTRNILYEIWSCAETKSKGWALLTKADHLIVFYSETDFYTIRLDDLRSFIKAVPESITTKQITQSNGYTTRFWLVPIDFVAQRDYYTKDTGFQTHTLRLKVQYGRV